MRRSPVVAAVVVFIAAVALAATGTAGTTPEAPQDAQMSFFITSAGPGNGADLGGLEGADRHC